MPDRLKNLARRIFRPWSEAARLRADLAAAQAGWAVQERRAWEADNEASGLRSKLKLSEKYRQKLGEEKDELRQRAEKAEAERGRLGRKLADVRTKAAALWDALISVDAPSH